MYCQHSGIRERNLFKERNCVVKERSIIPLQVTLKDLGRYKSVRRAEAVGLTIALLGAIVDSAAVPNSGDNRKTLLGETTTAVETQLRYVSLSCMVPLVSRSWTMVKQ